MVDSLLSHKNAGSFTTARNGSCRNAVDQSIIAVNLLLGVLLSSSALGQETTTRAGQENQNAAIYKRIEELRKRSALIKVDGKDADWEGIPYSVSPRGSAQEDLSRKIIKVAIAPRDDDLLVLIVTAGKPSRDDSAFCLSIDFTGDPGEDIILYLSPRGRHVLWIPVGGTKVGTEWDGAEVAIDDVVEVRIPYDRLARALPPQLAESLRGSKRCPWIRVVPYTLKSQKDGISDYGPAVASYLLIPTPYALDPILPRSGKSLRAVELPVIGKWCMGQEPFGSVSHKGEWAYDLGVVSSTHHATKSPGSQRNEDHYCWGKPVFCPVPARVLRIRNDSADTPIAPPVQITNGPFRAYLVDPTRSQEFANEVLLDLGDDLALLFAHFQKGSVAVEPGQMLSAGAKIGRVGNSGPSYGPHLHIALKRLSDEKISLPMSFANVRVSLNHSVDDPWARDLAIWEPRQGMFVERQK
jgi:hypothetical protein